MKIYRSIQEISSDALPTIATIGNFDGVHCAHSSVIAEVMSRARTKSQRSLAITFDPHPVRVLRPDAPHRLITPLPRKLELLAATGIDATLVLPFDDAFCRISARTFAETILRDGVHATELHEGENFRFGYKAEAGIHDLELLGAELGFTVRIFAPQVIRRQVVSSSRIRKLISAGQVSHARALLGRPFSIDSIPASGRGYGTRFTVPTINLAPYPELLPANGVYITTLQIGAGNQAEIFEAVTNIGNRPTFGPEHGPAPLTVESHLLNFHPIDLTESEETPLRLTFLKFLRPEIRWPDPEALKAQIQKDVAQAKRLFSLIAATTPGAPSSAQLDRA